MNSSSLYSDTAKNFEPLPRDFNKKKLSFSYPATDSKNILKIRSLSEEQCLGRGVWPKIDIINSWMISAETRTFMKWGGLGMIASELPEAFNKCFGRDGHRLSVLTPLYVGDTKKKKASFDGQNYTGAEQISVAVQKIAALKVPFADEKSKLTAYDVNVYRAHYDGVDYFFFENERFFSINPHEKNPSAQDGCYVLNEFNINEVERFAFLSKAVYKFLEFLTAEKNPSVPLPNVLLANDWHSGALGGLTKYYTLARSEAGQMTEVQAGKLRNIPLVHIAHHLGYQGWDYENTARLLNSLYEDMARMVFANAKAVKNNNPRDVNSLIVADTYNQSSCNFHLADRVVTVSKNYAEEVSKELSFGYDFRDILKIRKDNGNFYGIVNGYDKKLISPIKEKIDEINSYFRGFDFRYFDESSLDIKLENKRQFLKLLSRLASDEGYRQETIPQIDIYKFDDIAGDIKDVAEVPVFCATSRLVEQKGYDIAASAILDILKNRRFKEPPVFVLGGAGDAAYFKMLTKLKDKVAKFNLRASKRIYVFRGYKDQFAYAVQLASDFYLMPSRFEPCGLTQMEAMAKGTLPIAMSTGGLVDTISDGIDGFRTEVFFAGEYPVYGDEVQAKLVKNNENAYARTLQKALDTFVATPAQIEQMKINAMRKDFSWDVEKGSVYKYFELLKTGTTDI